MPQITHIDKTPAVAAKVKGATLKFNEEELSYLKVALEVAYKAHQDSTRYYVAPVARGLHKAIKAAQMGEYATYGTNSPFFKV